MQNISKCKCVDSDLLNPGELYGHFVFTLLEQSEGNTIGNILRRILLSNLYGLKITGVRLPNVTHNEFNLLEGVREDFLEIILNLKEIILKIGYKHYMSDTRTYNRKLWVENVERHYLKPPIRFDENHEAKKRLIQRYGNILIELLFRNDELVNLKFRAKNYNDHNFTEANSFSDLMREIIQNG